MAYSLRFLFCLLVLASSALAIQAQNNINTATLPVNSICPGTQVSVYFQPTGSALNTTTTYVVQLSDGGAYNNIATGPASLTSYQGTGHYVVTATIPANQAAGTTYSIRVTANNPAVIGTPSATKLTIKTRPAPPKVEAVQLDCQRRIANDLTSNIYLERIPGADPRLYNKDQSLASTIPYSFQPENKNVFIQLPKPFYSSDDGFVYPFSEVTKREL